MFKNIFKKKNNENHPTRYQEAILEFTDSLVSWLLGADPPAGDRRAHEPVFGASLQGARCC